MSTPILTAEKLRRDFTMGGRTLTVLDGVDLSLERGESLAITGPSGSGKSTLLALLAGLDRPTRGRVVFSGMDLAAMDEDRLASLRARRIGFMFQSYRLLPTLTAEENVRVPLELGGDARSRGKAKEWLERVGLDQRMRHMPSQLSGGEQQRVALARALAAGPEIVFADEPTGNLDSRTGQEMADLLFGLAKEKSATLVLVTHEASLAERAERRLALKDGRASE